MNIHKTFIEYITEEAKKKKRKKKKSTKRKSRKKSTYGNTWPNRNVSPFGYMMPFSRFYDTPDVINNINITNSNDGSSTATSDGTDAGAGE